ncbi:MAG: type IIA DNA topoisomerase subunit B [Oscillospiraceae bacterium]|jgi:DNA gyrase subunit B|nr:type IIA DNA topoisomerase subunit B [Oscillospiraceae bacterium]
MAAKKYDASDIQVLEGLEAVRVRPGMYIGSTGPRGLHHLLWEIVDNAIDEAVNGFASVMSVTLHRDGSASVTDNGRGLPVDPHPLLGVSGAEVIFTKLHAGGKFNHDQYQYSGGLHGVGASVVNALSQWLTVEIERDGGRFGMRFESGYNPAAQKTEAGKPVEPLRRLGPSRAHGTRVRFMPDGAVFEDSRFSAETVRRRLRDLAYLNQGLKITFIDERATDPAEREQTYLYEGGIADLVRDLNKDKSPLHPAPILFEGSRDGIRVRAAIQYTDDFTENLFSYVNNIPTGEGGTHEAGFRAGYTKAFNEYARRAGFIKDKDPNLSGEDTREGMTGCLSVYVPNPQFEGQTKSRLGNTDVRPAVESMIAEKLGAFMEDLKNAPIASTLVEKAVRASKVREAARKARDLARQKNQLEAAPLVGKLASCTGRKAEENELFIVEGDSAGGSAKQGRDRRFQAILPLRGKPLNVERKQLDKVLGNEEFRTIITALGAGVGEDFETPQLKYNRVIILSDADQDGAHIRAILLTFFFRYMRPMVAEGHVYIGLPPLYRVQRGSTVRYAYDDAELRRITKTVGRDYTVQRYKGLGEMDPEQLWETTMNPANRKLLRVTLDDAADAERMVSLLMGERVDPRREFIIKHANFNKRDTFQDFDANRKVPD